MLAKLRHVHRTTHFITSWKYNGMYAEWMNGRVYETHHNACVAQLLDAYRSHSYTLSSSVYKRPKMHQIIIIYHQNDWQALCEWRRIKRWSLKAEAAVGTERHWSLTSVQLLCVESVCVWRLIWTRQRAPLLVTMHQSRPFTVTAHRGDVFDRSLSRETTCPEQPQVDHKWNPWVHDQYVPSHDTLAAPLRHQFVS